MTLTAAIRDRLQAIATAAQTAAEALDGLDALDLDADALEGILFSLAGVCGQLDDVTDRLGAGVDPMQLCGR
jgi:hypothetical protein